MTPDICIAQLRTVVQFFNKSTDWLTEADEGFTPVEGMFSASQQVAHAAQTIDWFIDGGFGPGFAMNFEEHEAEVRKITSVAAARAWFDRAVENAVKVLGSQTAESVMSPLPEDGLMGGAPRGSIISGIAEHTSHHRGALAVYARLCGKTPAMPYM